MGRKFSRVTYFLLVAKQRKSASHPCHSFVADWQERGAGKVTAHIDWSEISAEQRASTQLLKVPPVHYHLASRTAKCHQQHSSPNTLTHLIEMRVYVELISARYYSELQLITPRLTDAHCVYLDAILNRVGKTKFAVQVWQWVKGPVFRCIYMYCIYGGLQRQEAVERTWRNCLSLVTFPPTSCLITSIWSPCSSSGEIRFWVVSGDCRWLACVRSNAVASRSWRSRSVRFVLPGAKRSWRKSKFSNKIFHTRALAELKHLRLLRRNMITGFGASVARYPVVSESARVEPCFEPDKLLALHVRSTCIYTRTCTVWEIYRWVSTGKQLVLLFENIKTSFNLALAISSMHRYRLVHIHSFTLYMYMYTYISIMIHACTVYMDR